MSSISSRTITFRTMTVRTIAGTLLAIAAAACGPAKSGDDGDDDDGGPACAEGDRQCDGSFLNVCHNGHYEQQELCPLACSPTIGCVTCVPGTATCDGNVATVCRGDGSGTTEFTCDPVQGVTCDGAAGGCVGDCAPQNLGSSYIGCDYYPTVTANDVSNAFEFAVAVANTGARAAQVTIEGGALGAPQVLSVPAQSVTVSKLPWVPSLKVCNLVGGGDACPQGALNVTTLASRGSYHLRSDAPVTVYQFNPLDYTHPGGAFSFTNDASLLLPVNVWRDKYVAATWQFGVTPLPPWPGLIAVTAQSDGTMVTVTPRAPTAAGGGVPAMTTGVPATVVLNAGDAMQIGNVSGDLTGSLIESSKPIQVIGGHVCTFVPDGVRYCDHLEESMFSLDALGKSYVLAPPAVPALPDGKVRSIRIIAGEPNTTLTYDPPQPGAATTLARVGDFVELPRNSAYFTVTSDQKILVSQYMSGQEAGGNTGDPAMALAVPVEQFRRDYLFHAPTNYDSNYVDVVVKSGVTVMLDNQPIPAGRAVGADGWTVSRVQLTNGPGNDGNHSMSASDPFGITVYGYGQYTSYWYAGGLDLNDIPID